MELIHELVEHRSLVFVLRFNSPHFSVGVPADKGAEDQLQDEQASESDLVLVDPHVCVKLAVCNNRRYVILFSCELVDGHL